MLSITSQVLNNVTRQLSLGVDSFGAVFVDWGDGTTVAATQTQAPNQTTGVIGKYTAAKTYAKEGFYEVVVRSNDIKKTLGVIWVGRTIPAFDPEKRLPDMQERWRREAARVESIGQARRY